MVPYIYLLGMQHGGSTLLTFLLNAHPEIVSVGEVSRVDDLIPDRWLRKNDRCSCGEPFFRCGFWQRTLAGTAARGFGLGQPHFFSGDAQSGDLPRRKLAAFAEAALEVSGARLFLDGSKFPDCLAVLKNSPHFDLYVLDLYRDGRGVVNSWVKHFYRNPRGRHPIRRWDTRQVLAPLVTVKMTRGWVARERERRAVLAGIPPERVHRLDYETLAVRPEETLAEIFAFLGAGRDENVTRGYKSAAEHHIIGNPMRLSDHETIVLDEKWRRQMTPAMRLAFDLLGGRRMNRENGYPER